MPGLIRKSLDSPEEVRKFEAGSGQLELVNLDAGPVGRATFQPGWRWSQHVRPIAKTDSCRAAHTGYFISGRMKVVMDDGEEPTTSWPCPHSSSSPATWRSRSSWSRRTSSTQIIWF